MGRADGTPKMVVCGETAETSRITRGRSRHLRKLLRLSDVEMPSRLDEL
jgi:hypothetical protein